MIKKIEDINKYIGNDRLAELVRSAENFHSNQYNDIINMLINDRKGSRLVCIAGPSSSGKTIFSNKLRKKLSEIGVKSMVISMDNYFLDKEFIKADEFGKYDFESIDIIDILLFKKHMEALTKGEGVYLTHYNFFTGKKEYDEEMTFLDKDSMVFIEGIHALNYDELYSHLDREKIFGVYIAPQDSYLSESGDMLEPHQIRLVRRAVRDSLYRNCKLPGTLAMWDSVRNGEKKYISPYKVNADYCFNSSIKYEIPVLKKYFIEEYNLMDDENREICERHIHKKTLEEFFEAESEIVPQASILNEFIPKTS